MWCIVKKNNRFKKISLYEFIQDIKKLRNHTYIYSKL